MEGWSAPRPLIQSNGNGLAVDEETARQLADIRLPVTVVTIAGIYRTGKSYLMNRLANKQSGFPLGDTLQSKTKGIWVWCLPHPHKDGHALLLLDTEGLSDPEKASERDDIQLLCLSVLLSSFFVYNAIGKIDQEMINRLYFLSEVLDSISAKTRQSPSEELSTPDYDEIRKFLPDFSLVVRDFSLELKIDDRLVTPDEYFDKVLQPLEGNAEDWEKLKYNRPREAIRRAFRSHRCFVFSRPVEDDDQFCKLEHLKENELSPCFVQQSTEFCNFVHSNANPKKIKSDNELAINGQVWLALAREYVTAMNNGAVPNIESTFSSVAGRTNEAAITECVQIYNDGTKGLAYPLSVAEVQSTNQIASNQSINRFQQLAVADTGDKYLSVLKNKLSEAFTNITQQNEHVSRTKCRQLLDSIYNRSIQPKIQQSIYISSNTGSQMYEADLQALQTEYNGSPSKGCMEATVLQEFLNERQGERTHIQQAIEQRILREKQEEEARRQREAAELAARMEQLRLEEERRRNEELQRQQEEERLSLEKKLEEDRRQQEAALQRRLSIEAQMLKIENSLRQEAYSQICTLRWLQIEHEARQRAEAEQQRLLEEQRRQQAAEEQRRLEEQRRQHEAQLEQMRADAAAAMKPKKRRKWYKI